MLVVCIAIGAAAVMVYLRRERCEPSTLKLAGVWDEGRKLDLQKSFAANRDALKTIEASLDAFTSTWATTWDAACADEKAPRNIRYCLDGRLAHVAALSDAFSRTDADIANAPVALERLAALGACNPGLAEPPRGGRAERTLAQSKIARSEVLRRAGKREDAAASATEAVALAEKSLYAPLLAEALLVRADELRSAGKAAQAEQTLARAQSAALLGNDLETLSRICLSTIVLLGSQPSRAAKAEPAVACVTDALLKLPSPAIEAELHLALALLRLEQGKPPEAAAEAKAAREAFVKNNQPVRALDAAGILVQSLGTQGKLDDAAALAAEVLKERAAILGDGHVQTSRARLALGQLKLKAHRPQEALDALTPLTAALMAALPPANQTAVLCARGKAMLLLKQPAALVALKGCSTLADATFGSGQLATAPAHDALAAGLRAQNDVRHAIDEHLLAITALGSAKTPDAAAAHGSYAVTLVKKGDFGPARARAKLSLQIFDQVPADQSIDPCAALWAFAEAGARLRSPTAVKEARAALGCVEDQPRRDDELARAALTLGLLLDKNREAIGLLKTAANEPSLKLTALDALATLRPIDAAAACAAAIEALVREPNPSREKAAKGCSTLPRK